MRLTRHPFAAVIALAVLTWALAPSTVAPSAVSDHGAPLTQASASYQSPGPQAPVSLGSHPVAGATAALYPATADADGGAVPFALVDAYDRAVLAAPTDCHLTSGLLSAIGQVESRNLAGLTLDSRHRATPPVFGPLPKRGDADALRDTDGGQWDKSAKWDRGVGPMQLIPSAWRTVAVDLDGDGLRDPQDVYDAAGAVMVHLCQDGRDLATPEGLREAVLAYHHSQDFLRLVLSWKSHFDSQPLLGITNELGFLSMAATMVTPPTASEAPAPSAEVAPARAMSTPAGADTDAPAAPAPTASASVPQSAPSPPAQASQTAQPADPATESSQPASPATTEASPSKAPPPVKTSKPGDPEPTPTCPTLPPGATPTPGTDATAPATASVPPEVSPTADATDPAIPPGCPALPTPSPGAPESTPAP